MIVSGIYEIRNTVNGKRYIGSAVNLPSRFAGHVSRLNKGEHHNAKLQNAWQKYGREVFEFALLQIVFDRADLIIWEQRYIDELKPAYNISPTAGSPLGVKHTAETRAKISAAGRRWKRPPMSEAQKEKLRVAHIGKKLSPKHRAAIGLGLIGTKAPPRSEEWKAKQRVAQCKENNPEKARKISEKAKGRSRGPHSPETRAKIAESNRRTKAANKRRA